MTHYQQRIQDRQIGVSESQIVGLCYEYECAAVILSRVEHKGTNTGDYHGRMDSNGDLIVLIIRDHRAVTIMYRRSNQPQTCEALHVSQVIDLTN